MSDFTIKLNMRKTLSNNLLVKDHPEFYITISEKNKKIVTFPKKDIDEFTYDHQKEFFDSLIDKGVIEPESIQGSIIYNGLEGKYVDNYETNSINQVLLAIYDFMVDFKLKHAKYLKYEEDYREYILNPDDEDTTELGEVPAEDQKGSIPKHPFYFGTSYGAFNKM